MLTANPRNAESIDRDDFATMDATEQGALVRAGKASALELVDAAIARIERINPKLNALASSNFELARETARNARRTGVFAGVPTLIKDLMAYPGYQASFGSRLVKGFVPPQGTPYTDALDASGLIVLGKSATSEFGLVGTTETLANGATHNPWDLSRSPGGSSGGAVAAVAGGLVPVAHASDGGGSIRGPSSFTGLFGFKPSLGRTLFAGMPEEMPTARLLAEHCVSRSVRDSANWLAATEKPDRMPPLPSTDALKREAKRRLRIGTYRRDCFGQMPSTDALCVLDRTIEALRGLGHEIVEIDGPDIGSAATSKAFFALSGAMVGGILQHMREMMGPAFDASLVEPYSLDLVARAQSIAPAEFATFVGAFDHAAKIADAVIADVDMLLTPTVGFSAFRLGEYGPETTPEKLDRFIERLASYTVVASLAGWPAMSVPLFLTGDGLPIGSHFAARKGEDALLFSLAFELEEAYPWAGRLNQIAERLDCHSA